jgi:hypothetical protein
MVTDITKAMIVALEVKGEVRREGKGWRARCPNPDHKDVHPSFFLYPDGGGCCSSQRARHRTITELALMLGVSLPEQSLVLTGPCRYLDLRARGVTCAQIARELGLTREHVSRTIRPRALGLLLEESLSVTRRKA